MTTFQILTFSLTFGLFSCNGKSESSKKETEKVLLDTQIAISVPDSTKKFIVDDYPVTNEMFLKQSEQNSYHELRSGKSISHDKVWFGNDSTKQTLVFELYTDYHRMLTYHFYNNDIPNDLINKMEIHIDGGELATKEQKQKDFTGFVNQSKNINSNYFITNKGFKLGDNKQIAIDKYGSPDKSSTRNGIEKLEWSFIGDETYDGKTDLKGKPLAKESFGNQIVMYFRNGKLIGQILHNDIP